MSESEGRQDTWYRHPGEGERGYEVALEKIEALDRAGHISEVAAEMGYIARRALQSSPCTDSDSQEQSESENEPT